jgi:hypothetical protein
MVDITDGIAPLSPGLLAGQEGLVLAVCLAALFCLVVFALSGTFLRLARRIRQLEEEALHHGREQQCLALFDELNLEMSALRHDLGNHFQAVCAFVENNETDRLRTYITQFWDVVKMPDTFVCSGNKNIDVIVNSKLLRARQKGISMKVRAQAPETLPLTDLETISLIGNLMDNAIESCGRVMEGQGGSTDRGKALRVGKQAIQARGIERGGHPFVDIEIRHQRDEFFLRITNSALAPHKGCAIFATCKEGARHGIGLAQVRRLANRYGGFFSCGFRQTGEEAGASLSSDGTFTATVLLPLGPQAEGEAAPIPAVAKSDASTGASLHPTERIHLPLTSTPATSAAPAAATLAAASPFKSK